MSGRSALTVVPHAALFLQACPELGQLSVGDGLHRHLGWEHHRTQRRHEAGNHAWTYADGTPASTDAMGQPNGEEARVGASGAPDHGS